MNKRLLYLPILIYILFFTIYVFNTSVERDYIYVFLVLLGGPIIGLKIIYEFLKGNTIQFGMAEIEPDQMFLRYIALILGGFTLVSLPLLSLLGEL